MADDFQRVFMKNLLSGTIKAKFEIVNAVFETADCYWDECLPGLENAFEISE